MNDRHSSTPKPRIFVSSVMDGFESFRDAARRGVLDAGFEPVMAEDWASAGTSSRNACLDGVAKSDGFLMILGERAGWKTPSGKHVVEEEWQEAKDRKLPARVFVQDGVDRDAEAKKLVSAASDYINGLFRRSFTTPETLATEVQRALEGMDVRGGSKGVLARRAEVRRRAALPDGEKGHSSHEEAFIRVTVAPVRDSVRSRSPIPAEGVIV